MSLNNASILLGATTGFTGGTALPFSSLGQNGKTNTLYCTDDSDIRTRRDIVCSTVAPKVLSSAPNGYSQARSSIVVKEPLTLDNGNITVNTGRIEIATDVETTDAEKLAIRDRLIQILSDSDFLEFWDNQSLV